MLTSLSQRIQKAVAILPSLLLILLLTACNSGKKTQAAQSENSQIELVGPSFNADSALHFCAKQCTYGPRTMNSNAHDECEEWIIRQFKAYGCDVITQKTKLEGWDGKMLRSTNIIARINPEATERILICAHWDSRPWADNDPDSTKWRTPVMAANDGASGVAVMLELARSIDEMAKKGDSNGNGAKSLAYGIDFVCFDAEDYGAPEWSGVKDSEDTWALGAQFFAKNLPESPAKGNGGATTKYSLGILLDMVGGQGAHFYYEGLSKHYANDTMEKVWQAAADAGYSSYFLAQDGFTVTDDHKPLNEAGIPTIDIISYYPDCEQSGFGPTWHTSYDDMNSIDAATMKAVGQSLIQFLYTR